MAKAKAKTRDGQHRLNVPLDQWRVWQAQAEREGRSVSKMVQRVMAEYLSRANRLMKGAR